MSEATVDSDDWKELAAIAEQAFPGWKAILPDRKFAVAREPRAQIGTPDIAELRRKMGLLQRDVDREERRAIGLSGWVDMVSGGDNFNAQVRRTVLVSNGAITAIQG